LSKMILSPGWTSFGCRPRTTSRCRLITDPGALFGNRNARKRQLFG
jgi:hypothetical protein